MDESHRVYDVLIFGGYFCDLIVTGLPELPRLGADLFGTGMGIHAGGTFNTVRALHRLGLRVGWVCDFGNDPFSQLVLSEIAQEGVDMSLFRVHQRPQRAISLAYSFANDRGFISYMDPVEAYPRAPFILEHRPRCLLFHYLEYGPEAVELARTARQVGALIGMDCQATRATLETPGVAEALRQVDVFLPNASEALGLTGAADIAGAAEALAALAPLVVIKLGEDGALARSAEQEIYAPALQVEVIDTTGAGDCFNAGFLFGYLRGNPLETCLRIGNICGALSATAYGASATPSWEEAQRFL
jgi:sugar/nucleoside kinase (ribokinase family)